MPSGVALASLFVLSRLKFPDEAVVDDYSTSSTISEPNSTAP